MSQLMHMLMLMHMLRPSCDGTDSVQRRFKGPGYFLVGRRRRPAPEDSARTTVCLGSLGFAESRESRVESRESRVESRESRVKSSHQPQPQSQSGYPTRANLVHMYDAQDMKKKRDVNERSAGADSVVSFGLSVGHPSSESSNDALAPEDFKKFRVYVRLSTMIFFF